MESRYYLFPGQTLQNTNISDRSHALHITKEEWNKINKHLDRKKMAQEARDREERHKKYLGEGSRSMIKNWANSLENIRKRKEEEREKAIEEEKIRRQEKFIALRKEQEEQRNIFVEKARKGIFMTTANAKLLTSAFVEGEAMLEREKQIEFKEMIKQHEKEEEAKEIEDIKRVAKEHAKEVKAYKEGEKRKRKEWGEEMRKYLTEKAKKEQEEAEKQRQENLKEYEEAWNEIRCMEQRDLNDKINARNTLKATFDSLVKQKQDALALQKTEDKELDVCNQVYLDAKQQIDCKKRAREKEIREAEIEFRYKAAQVAFECVGDSRLELEEKAYQKAVLEKEAEYLAKQKIKQESREREIRDKIEGYKHSMEKNEERLKKEKELRKWEMANNFKKVEVLKKCEKERKKREWEAKLKYRKELFDQAAETKAAELEEKERHDIVEKAIQITDDDRFFAYADELLENARKKGRSTRPIELAIMHYRKTNLLDRGEVPIPKDDPSRCDDYTVGMKLYTRNFINEANKKEKEKKKCKCKQ